MVWSDNNVLCTYLLDVVQMTGYQSKKAAAQDKLAQPAQEPVGVVATDTSKTHIYYGTQYLGQKTDTKMVMLFKDLPLGTPVYTTPPQEQQSCDKRPWVGLTEQEFQLIYDMGRTPSGMMEMVESMLKDKNT